jgi:hypothetical protein
MPFFWQRQYEEEYYFQRILHAIEHLERRLFPAPVAISLALPTITRNGVILPNFELKNDTVASIPVEVEDAAGAVVPTPAGDTFTAVSSNPASLTAIITPGTSTLVLTPLVQASPGLSVAVNDANGLTAVTLVVDIVADLSPTQVALDVADATTVSQPVPENPGP